MRLRRLLASLIGITGVYMVTLPAKAARLQAWQFDESQNRLSFTTEVGVQPRAQLLTHPVRLVVDVPGVTLDQLVHQQPVDGVVRSVRVHGTDAAMTRFELELAPDYLVRPQDIHV